MIKLNIIFPDLKESNIDDLVKRIRTLLKDIHPEVIVKTESIAKIKKDRTKHMRPGG